MKRYCFVHKVSSLCEVEVLLVEQAMLFVPLFKTIWPIDIMHYLLPLRPAHPFGFGTLHDADHLIWSRKLGVDGGRKRVNQFGPVVIPQPQHSAAVGAEVSLRGTFRFLGCSSIFDGGILPNHR